MSERDLQSLISAADRCVLCGLCSSHCPTYRLHREEGESPRGRVMMSIALLKGEMEPSEGMESHLNHCLLCRACERACPSEVPYGEILDRARTRLAPPTGLAKLLERAVLHPRLLRGMATAASLWGGARLPLPAIGRAALRTQSGHPARPMAEHHPAAGEPVGRVGLFLGCVATPLDRQTHRDATTLLTHLGYEVVIPRGQQCCGAVSQHHGNPEQAEVLAEANREAFGGEPLDAILFTSSGCGVQLIEHGKLPVPCFEICDFLLQSPRIDQLALQPVAERVSLHHPCSLTNVLKGGQSVERVLQLIPELEILPLGPESSCCGAAGSHRLREPESADRLRRPKMEALHAAGTALLVTTNYGCALHLAEGMEREDTPIEVIHPVTLLARQLG